MKVKRLTVFVLLMVILAAAALLRFIRLDAVEPTWDELMDTATSISYRENPNPFDLTGDVELRTSQMSQARLPYYIAALTAYFVPGKAMSFSYQALWPYIYCARIPSVLFGVLTVLTVYFLGKGFYDTRTGIISALLLAISSYHIGFSRVEADSYDTFFYLLSLWVFFKGITTMNPKYLLFSGITTGIACACKFSAVLLLPTFFLFIVVYCHRDLSLRINSADKSLLRLLLLNAGIIYSFMLIFVHLYMRVLDAGIVRQTLFFFLAVVIVFLCILLPVILKMEYPFKNKDITVIFINIALMSIIFTFIGSPIHLIPKNLDFLLCKWLLPFLHGWPGVPMQSLSILPIEIIFLKLGIPFNLMLFGGLFYNLTHLQNRTNLFISLAFLVYFLVISIAKVFMSWYAMPILPLAIIISSRFIVVCWDAVKTKAVRIVLAVSIFAGVCFQLFTLAKIVPHYHLDGYKLGAKFIGYNKPSFIFVDGIRDAIGWLERNIPEYSRVGILYYMEIMDTHTLDFVFQHLAATYSAGKTIKYEHINSKEELGNYDYLIVSSVFGKEWAHNNSSFNLVCSISLSGLEVYQIYRNTANSNSLNKNVD